MIYNRGMIKIPISNKYTIQIFSPRENGIVAEIDFSYNIKEILYKDHGLLTVMNEHAFIIDTCYYVSEFKIIGADDVLTFINVL